MSRCGFGLFIRLPPHSEARGEAIWKHENNKAPPKYLYIISFNYLKFNIFTLVPSAGCLGVFEGFLAGGALALTAFSALFLGLLAALGLLGALGSAAFLGLLAALAAAGFLA